MILCQVECNGPKLLTGVGPWVGVEMSSIRKIFLLIDLGRLIPRMPETWKFFKNFQCFSRQLWMPGQDACNVDVDCRTARDLREQ